MEREESRLPTRSREDSSQKDTVEEAEETQGNKEKSRAVRQARVEAKPYDIHNLEKASATDLSVPAT